MPKTHKPRAGSLQFWPRKRATRILSSANWKPLQKKHSGLLGFICYKVGMIRVLARDLTPNSMTKNKQIIIPSTFVGCPPMRILAVRFYKDDMVVFDILNENLDKELKRKIKLPKEKSKIGKRLVEVEKKINEFDDIRLLVYTLPKETGLKKTPDIAEIGLGGSNSEKLDFVKKYISKDIKMVDFLKSGQVVDVRGVTKGHGFTGPVKRFKIGLRQHKSEKGRRRPGSVGPWTPSRITFRAPMAGQYGFFSRIQYNSKLLSSGSARDIEKFSFEFPHYGKIKTNYIIIRGSIHGPAKRQLLLTLPLRETRSATKKNFEILNLLK
ncbi:MAG: 50S ribosomal protein L3 [Candidatus Pacearchaeota archaeon]|nr:MAG: 50S ribosomal protein L3 [Candidatus Pacearchaeota archaeon]